MVDNKEVSIEQPHSCEISINAKRKWSGKVKVYSDTIDEAVLLTVKKANELDMLIKEKNMED